MTLQTWLRRNGLTMRDCAERLGVSYATVARWCAGDVYPLRASLRAIRDLTDGAVTPDDFPLAPPKER